MKVVLRLEEMALWLIICHASMRTHFRSTEQEKKKQGGKRRKGVWGTEKTKEGGKECGRRGGREGWREEGKESI